MRPMLNSDDYNFGLDFLQLTTEDYTWETDVLKKVLTGCFQLFINLVKLLNIVNRELVVNMMRITSSLHRMPFLFKKCSKK